MYYKISPLVITPEKNAGTISDVYVSAPEMEKERVAGRFFALIEISSHTPDNLKVISFLINDLEENYYHSERLMAKERPRIIKVEHIFEAAIAKTNKNLLDFVAAEKIKFNPYELNVIVGIVHENSLHFANIGKNKAFLIYKNKVSGMDAKIKAKIPVKEVRYKLTNIIEETSGGEVARIDEKKIFSSVISGVIPSGGYFVFANEALSEYISEKQLIDIVTTLPPASAVEQVRMTLSSVNTYIPFLGIIIKNTFGLSEEEEIIEEQPRTTRESIRNLNTIEEKTEEYLAPGGYLNMRKLWKRVSSFVGGAMSSAVTAGKGRIPQPEDIKERVLAKRRLASIILGNIWKGIKVSILFVLSSFVSFFKFITDKEKIVAAFFASGRGIKNFFIGIKEFFVSLATWYSNLILRNKIIVLVIIGCFVLFVGNIGWKTFESKRGEEIMALAATAKSIEQKQNQVEATLLYGDEAGARKLLAEIKDLLDKLPKPKNGAADQYLAYRMKYDVQIAKIRHVEQLDSLVVLADFSNLEASATPENMVAITGDNDLLYAADSAKKEIYKLTATDKAASSIKVPEEQSGLKFPNQDKGGNVYYLDGDQLLSLDVKSGKTSAAKVSLTEGRDNILDAKMFNNKLYLLSKDGQIYRHTRSAAGYSGGEKWLDEQADFSNASSMDINGIVFVVKTDGTILKFLKGAREQLSFDPVEPAISSYAKIIVGADEKYFYVLEPSQKRLVVFDGNGKFLMQYTSKLFTDLKDFAINEKQKIIYFLNGSVVYRAEMRHLK